MHAARRGIPVLVLVASALAATAGAQSVPGPCPTPRRAPVLAQVQPAMPCEGREVRLAFLYFCCTEVALAETDAGPMRLDIVTWPDSCAGALCAPDTLFVPLGHLAAGSHSVTVEYHTTWREGGSSCVTSSSETLAFEVARECPPPTGIFYLQHVDIGRADQQACPGDSIPVRLSGTLPDDCTGLLRVEVIPSPLLSGTGPVHAPPTVRLVFAENSCLDRPCIVGPVPWAAMVKIPPLLPRDWRLRIEALGLDVCPVPVDTTFLGANGFPFTVLEACDPAPAGCLLPGWQHPHPGARCDTFIGPDREARLTFTIGTETPLAGLQGTLLMQPPGLRVANVEAVGPAAGMQLSWNPTPGGMRFLLFATGGAPIPGGTLPDSLRVPVLRLTFAPDPAVAAAPRTRVFPADLLGSDALGRAVYVCPTFAPIDASAFVCRARPCDFNGDGLADVRDLVRMVRCVTGVDDCDPTHTARFDCDGSGSFDIDDVLCCALAILTEHPAPDGGPARPAELRLAMGLPVSAGGAIEIPMEISGDQPVGAARLVFRLPTEAFADVSVRAAPGTPDLAVHEVGPGFVTVGLIRTGAVPPGTPLPFTLRLTPASGTTPAGEVTLVSSDFAAPDGVRLAADPGEPIAVIGAVGEVTLGAARPNPFGEEQRIPLVMPRRENADLSVFDLSGRRVRTLYHGLLDAGAHTFTWDGRDESGARLPGGVYFYRVAVDGITTARRVVMLDDSR